MVPGWSPLYINLVINEIINLHFFHPILVPFIVTMSFYHSVEIRISSTNAGNSFDLVKLENYFSRLNFPPRGLTISDLTKPRAEDVAQWEISKK